MQGRVASLPTSLFFLSAMPRPIHATIRLDALRNNHDVARGQSGAARAWCVVKANAYGHGLAAAVEAWHDKADGFALLDLDEAVRLRESGVRQPILLLEGPFEPADLLAIAEHELTPVIHHADQVDMLLSAGLPWGWESYGEYLDTVDTLPLARWAKLTLAVESMASLFILGLVLARGVNILN